MIQEYAKGLPEAAFLHTIECGKAASGRFSVYAGKIRRSFYKDKKDIRHDGSVCLLSFHSISILSNAVDSLGQTGDLSGNGVLVIYTLCPSFCNLNDSSL